MFNAVTLQQERPRPQPRAPFRAEQVLHVHVWVSSGFPPTIQRHAD